MRTTIWCLAPVKAGVAGGVDLLAKPVQFVVQTVKAFHVAIVGGPGHRRLLPANPGYSAADPHPAFLRSLLGGLPVPRRSGTSERSFPTHTW